jgi:opacity protein-like surface antigen
MKKILLLMLLINVIAIANGQNEDSKWSIGISAGRTDYSGDLGNALTDQNGQDFQGFGALTIGRYLNKSFDLNLRGSYGNYGFKKTADLKFHGTKFDGNLLLIYKLNNGYIFNTSAFIAPYLAGGVGVANTDTKSGLYSYNYGSTNNTITQGIPFQNNGTDFIITVGGGIKFNFSRNFALQLQSLFNLIIQMMHIFLIL